MCKVELSYKKEGSIHAIPRQTLPIHAGALRSRPVHLFPDGDLCGADPLIHVSPVSGGICRVECVELCSSDLHAVSHVFQKYL